MNDPGINDSSINDPSVNDRQFQVRIKLQNNGANDVMDDGDDALEKISVSQDAGYTYHFARIFTACLLLVAIGWAAFEYLTFENVSSGKTDAIKVSTINQITESSPPAAIHSQIQTELSNKDLSNKKSFKKESSISEPSGTESSNNGIVNIETVMLPLPADVVKPIDSVGKHTVSPQGGMSHDIPTHSSSEFGIPRVDIKSVKSLTERVHRVKFAKSVENKEPVGEGNLVVADKNGIAKLVFFTEITGFKDQFITHNWFYEGKKEATIKIGVWANQYRCYSSKYLTRDKTGRWQVVVSDSRGNQLAVGDFDYLAPSS